MHYGNFELTAKKTDLEQLKKLAMELSNSANAGVVIRYPARQETQGRYYQLSETRSLYLLQYLVQHGVDPARISREKSGILHPESEGKGLNEKNSITVTRTAGFSAPVVLAKSEKCSANSSNSYSVYFSFDSAIFNDEAGLICFAQGLANAPGKLQISGHTDMQGNNIYNQNLSFHRALVVYERMLQLGLTSTKITILAFGMDQPIDQGHSIAANKVNRRAALLWIPEIPKPATEPVPETIVAEKPREPFKLPDFDIVPFAGLIIPTGFFATEEKSAVAYGLGIAKNFELKDANRARVGFYLSKMTFKTPKNPELSGYLNLKSYALRADYIWNYQNWLPFVGLTLGVFPWDGEITRDITQEQNTGSRGTDIGSAITVGAGYKLAEHFELAPELAYYNISGGFDGSFLSMQLALYVRIK